MVVIINKNTTCKEIMDIIKKSGGKLLTDVRVFDLYQGDELSVAFTLTFEDPTRTLTDSEVMELFNKIASDVTTRCNVKLKSL